MYSRLLPPSILTLLLSSAASADVPTVTTDIAPVHALVARVMEGVGVPALIVKPGATPHEYRLRPSEAAALDSADLVFWIGPDLTPWLGDAIETLAVDAAVTELLEADGTELLAFRENALFEAHGHGDDEDHDDHEQHGHDDHDGHGHEDHDDHDHAEDTHEDHDEHDHDAHAEHEEDHAENDHDHAEDKHEDHDEHAGHDHGDHDPHAWLSVENARAWYNVIAGQLSAADPDNAGTYFANAKAGRDELEALSAEINATLAPVRGGQFIVFHDAFQYFERAFDFPASGAISISDASQPSPARLAEVQTRIKDGGIDCVLAEPQFNPGLVTAVLDGTNANTGIVDPLGAALEPGPGLYPQLLRSLATALAACMR